jgi:hypothetical protein
VREVVELGQRFDIVSDAVLFCGSGENWAFHGLQLGERRARRLLDNSYDLYVIAGFPMGGLPAEFQYLILKEVAEGAGLGYASKRALDRIEPALEGAVVGELVRTVAAGRAKRRRLAQEHGQ